MPFNPVVHDPYSYVQDRGIVEVQYGIENSQVEWSKDMYDYVREDMGKGERFDPEFCLKEKDTGKRYWFACIVCPCTLYRDENLVHHVKGQKHQKRALEKVNTSKNKKRKRDSNVDDVISLSRSSRSYLKELLMKTNFPLLGLGYITEYLNPGNPVLIYNNNVMSSISTYVNGTFC